LSWLGENAFVEDVVAVVGVNDPTTDSDKIGRVVSHFCDHAQPQDFEGNRDFCGETELVCTQLQLLPS